MGTRSSQEFETHGIWKIDSWFDRFSRDYRAEGYIPGKPYTTIRGFDDDTRQAAIDMVKEEILKANAK